MCLFQRTVAAGVQAGEIVAHDEDDVRLIVLNVLGERFFRVVPEIEAPHLAKAAITERFKGVCKRIADDQDLSKLRPAGLDTVDP